MRGEPCSQAWRTSALLLGASWIVTLAVACGGGGDGDDDVVVTPVTTGAVGVAAASSRTPAQMQRQTPRHETAALPVRPPQPCNDELLVPARFAADPPADLFEAKQPAPAALQHPRR